jgi:succinoglycan biosynthesis protein ExoA
MTDNKPGILVVIPTLNEAAHMRALLDKVVAGLTDHTARIVVAAGGSTDGTREIVAEMAMQNAEITLLHNPKRIQSAGVNLAVSSYGEAAEFLIRLDAHAGYPDDYFQVLLDEQQTAGAASVVVAMETVREGGFQSAVAAAQNSFLGNGGSAHRNGITEGRWVEHGHHALMQIAAFRAAGGYDETFPANEDAELDARLGKLGYRIWLTGKTVMTYYPRGTPKRLFVQYYRYGYGRLRTIVKQRVLPRLRQMAPTAVFPAFVLARGAG